MAQAPDAKERSSPPGPAELARLLPPAGPPATVAQTIAEIDFAARAARVEDRPYVVLNMASTVDGRATISGRSGSIGNAADRELFHGLRAEVDAVMAGAETIRVERYGRIIREPATRRARSARSLRAEPLACIVSSHVALAPDTPLLREPDAHVVVITPSSSSLPGAAARVDYIRTAHDGELDLHRALGELRERFAVHTLLCEGGPHLNVELLLAGLVDELFLSFSPLLVGGAEELRILAGPEFSSPLELELLSAFENGSQLLLRYAVCPSVDARVSRETTPSSSVAS